MVGNQLAAQCTTPSSSTSEPKLGWIPRLFAKIARQYGTRWEGQFGSEAAKLAVMQEWHDLLGDLDPQRIADYLRHRDATYPPTAAEFWQACRPDRHPAHQTFKALPRPPRNKETAKQQLSHIRNLIAGRVA